MINVPSNTKTSGTGRKGTLVHVNEHPGFLQTSQLAAGDSAFLPGREELNNLNQELFCQLTSAQTDKEKTRMAAQPAWHEGEVNTRLRHVLCQNLPSCAFSLAGRFCSKP